ncbi:MAG: MBL fold metallo-hydrolase [Planctomycetota bacterium]
MTAETDTPKLIKLAEGVFVRQAVDNISWFDLGGKVAIIDALEDRGEADAVFGALSETIGETPVTCVINTHTHGDHVALNKTFRKHFGAEIINARTADIPPEGRWFQGPRRRALMLPMGGLHTDEDCVIHLPDDRILFTGDLFGWGMIPLIRGLNAETMQRLERVYERLISFDAETIVPGHGPPATTEHLRRFVRYLHELAAAARAGVDAGKSDAEILAELTPPEDMSDWWRFSEWKHDSSVQKVLRAVRRGKL